MKYEPIVVTNLHRHAIRHLGTVLWMNDIDYRRFRSAPGSERYRDATAQEIAEQESREQAIREENRRDVQRVVKAMEQRW